MLNFNLESVAALGEWDRSIKLAESESSQRVSPYPPRTSSGISSNEVDRVPPCVEVAARVRAKPVSTNTLRPDAPVARKTSPLPHTKKSVHAPTATAVTSTAVTSTSASSLTGGSPPSRCPPPPPSAVTSSHAHAPSTDATLAAHATLKAATSTHGHTHTASPVSSFSASALKAVASAVAPLSSTPEHVNSPAVQTNARAYATTATGIDTTPRSAARVTPRGAHTLPPASRYTTLARPTPSRYQTFLFHGARHVLDHQTGLVIPLEAFWRGAATAAAQSAERVEAATVTGGTPSTAAPSSSPLTPSTADVHSFDVFVNGPRVRLPSIVSRRACDDGAPPVAAALTMTEFLSRAAQTICTQTLTYLADQDGDKIREDTEKKKSKTSLSR